MQNPNIEPIIRLAKKAGRLTFHAIGPVIGLTTGLIGGDQLSTSQGASKLPENSHTDGFNFQTASDWVDSNLIIKPVYADSKCTGVFYGTVRNLKDLDKNGRYSGPQEDTGQVVRGAQLSYYFKGKDPNNPIKVTLTGEFTDILTVKDVTCDDSGNLEGTVVASDPATGRVNSGQIEPPMKDFNKDLKPYLVRTWLDVDQIQATATPTPSPSAAMKPSATPTVTPASPPATPTPDPRITGLITSVGELRASVATVSANSQAALEAVATAQVNVNSLNQRVGGIEQSLATAVPILSEVSRVSQANSSEIKGLRQDITSLQRSTGFLFDPRRVAERPWTVVAAISLGIIAGIVFTRWNDGVWWRGRWNRFI